MERQILKSFIAIFIIIHLLISYVVGSLNPFDFTWFGRLVEVFLIGFIFLLYYKTKIT